MHVTHVQAAIDSCLAQSDPDIEVLVVEDRCHVEMQRDARVILLPNYGAGVCDARNTGLNASSGEFVMFLDADDVIHARKVELQVKELDRHPEAGWCCCDVVIDETAVGRGLVFASSRYDYHQKFEDVWLYPHLREANFIPVMAPLVRRAVLDEHRLRFHDLLVPEDWHFWRALAKESRCRYVDDPLATYIKRPNGRNERRVPKPYCPDYKEPLRLNLGCGTPGTPSWHPMPEMHNLDKSMGWSFEDGLGTYVEGSVAGLTVSHSLMYVPIEKWPFVFGEFFRVLEPGGVVRITEDATDDQRAAAFGGWKGSDPAVTLTTRDKVLDALGTAGFDQYVATESHSYYVDGSLIQSQHGGWPHAFFVEGVKRA